MRPGAGLIAVLTPLTLCAGRLSHDDDVPFRQFRHQDLFDIGAEGIAVHGPVQHHRRDHPAKAQSGGEGGGLPMTGGGAASLATRCPATQGVPS